MYRRFPPTSPRRITRNVQSGCRARSPVLLAAKRRLAELKQLIERPDVRLITIIGPGGVGKTRLALELARGLEAALADGMRFVDLASLGDPALVAATVAAACELHPTSDLPIGERLADYLSSRPHVLVLDNFEQLLAAAPLITELLAAAEQLKILVTSRVVLRLSGECIFVVPPLALPSETSELSPEQLVGSAAVRLFVERARAHGVVADAGVDELRIVADLCRQLDGLPLAIELAAARTRLLSPAALLERMEQRLPLLTGGPRDLPPRQQTVRDTIAWSFELLEPSEQRLLAMLSVFAGGCTVAAVEQICGEPANGQHDVLDGIASLLDSSLVQRQDAPGEQRIMLLETIREYALARAADDGSLSSLRERHARYYLGLAVTAERYLRGRQQEQWCTRLDLERRNMRVALDWFCEQRDIDHALQLGAALWWYWNQRGQRYDGLATLEALLELARLHAPRGGRARAAHAMVTLGVGVFSAAYDEYDHSDHRRAVAYIGQSTSLFRRSDDRWGLAWSLAYAVLYQPEHEQAPAWIEESRRLFAELDEPWGQVFALYCEARLLCSSDRCSEGIAQTKQAVLRFRELGDTWAMDVALCELSMSAQAENDSETEERILRDCLALANQQGDRATIAWIRNQLADALRWQNRYSEAQTLYLESEAMFRELVMRAKLACSIHGQGYTWLGLGDLDRATACFGQSLDLFRQLAHGDGIGWSFHGLAGVAARRSREGAVLAARLLGAAVNLTYDPLHWPRGPKQEYLGVVEAARRQLDQQRWEALFAEGKAMPLPEAVRIAYKVIGRPD